MNVIKNILHMACFKYINFKITSTNVYARTIVVTCIESVYFYNTGRRKYTKISWFIRVITRLVFNISYFT